MEGGLEPHKLKKDQSPGIGGTESAKAEQPGAAWQLQNVDTGD
jgi:hypothetical protein